MNKVAQGKLTLEEGLHWFKTLGPSEYRGILLELRFYLEQADPSQELINESITIVPLKPTMTPIVLFKTYPFKIAIAKVCELPDPELEKSFITLLTLFKAADTYRRIHFCKNQCTHEWHNLAEKTVNQDDPLLRRVAIWFKR